MKTNDPLEIIGRIQAIPEYWEVVRLGLVSPNSFGCWTVRAYTGTKDYRHDKMALESADFFDIFVDEEPSVG